MPALDGLRGAAVVAVVAYHLGWLRGGFLGVDVFFVLSGYLVTSLILEEIERTDRLGLRQFWGRRIRRLLPAVLVLVPSVLLGALAVGWTPTRLGALARDGVATLTWWANWRQAAGASYWAPGPSPFRHAWSLSIEEQFYLVWPIVVVAVAAVARRRGWTVRRILGWVAGLGVVAGATWMTVLARSLDAGALSRVYMGTDTRLLAPLTGCALACWRPSRREHRSDRAPAAPVVLGHLGLLVLGVLMASAHVTDVGMYRSGGFLVAALAAAALVYSTAMAGRSEPGGRRGVLGAASSRPLRVLGQRSYAIYLWSWPIQDLVQFRRPDWSRPLVTAVVVGATAVAAEISYRLVEDPIRRSRSWASRPIVRRPAWALALAVPLLLLVEVDHRATPAPAYESIDTARSVQQASQAPPPIRGGLTRSAGGSAPMRIMIEGDSVAFTAAYEAPQPDRLPKDIASIDGRGVIGCGLLAAGGWDYPSSDDTGYEAPAGGACVGQARAERIGLTGRPDVVMVISGAWEYQAARSPAGRVVPAQSAAMRLQLVDALVARARAAAAVGASFAMVDWSCPGSNASPQRRDPKYVEWINGVFARAAAAAQRAGVRARVVSPTPDVCTGGTPTGAPTAAWRAATADEVHIHNPKGGAFLWDSWLGPELAQWARG